jgi:hypothetical protein
VAGGHRLVSFQVEGHVMRGSDVEADAIALFARQVFDAIDGRSPTVPAPAAKATGAGSRTPAAAARRTPRSGG